MTISADKTIELLEARIKDNLKSLVFARLADLYLEQGRIDEAITLCTDSAKFHPYYVTGHFVLAKAFIAKRDLDKAESALKKVLSHDQQYPAAHKLLGDILCKTNRDSLAVAHYEDILLMDPLEEKVQKTLDRIPREAVKTAPAPSATFKKSKPTVEQKIKPGFELSDESWMDQIKEFHPDETDRLGEKKTETISSGDAFKDSLADFRLFDEKEKTGPQAADLKPDEEEVFTPPQKSVEDKKTQEIPDSSVEPLIGETPSDILEKPIEIENHYAIPELSPENIPGLIHEEPAMPSPDLPISSQAKTTELFPMSELETPQPKGTMKRDETEFPSFFHEPGVLDEATLASEPTVLDEDSPPKETTTEPSAMGIESPQSKLRKIKGKEPSVLAASIGESKPKGIESDFASLFSESATPPSSKPFAIPSEPSVTGTEPETPPDHRKVEKPPEEKKMPKIVTPTLGEIYAAQGQYEKAVKVYETLLEKNPNEKKYMDKIEEMKKKLKETPGK